MKFIKSNDSKIIQDYKVELYKSLSTPIDAMWENLYIRISQSYFILFEDNNIGYFCVNERGSLLQIYIQDDYKYQTVNIIKEILRTKLINSASLSSNEPISFNACLSISKSIKINTYCFDYFSKAIPENSELNLELVQSQDIDDIKSFLNNQIGFEDTFGYTENLVTRKEIFMLKESGIIIATSECRISETQLGCVDLGVIVNKDFQKKGLATRIINHQAERFLKMGMNPICSTTVDNIAAKKALEKAGFYCSNIIFDIELN